MDEKRKGTIILGTPRSGSTLLRRLIDSHPNICCPAETSVFTACGRFLRQERIAEDVPVGILSGMAFAGVPETETLARLRQLAFGLFEEICRRQDAQQWVSKTPHDVFYVDEIEQLCADHCKFLYLTRHGGDVALSLLDLCEKNGVYLSNIYDYIQKYPMPLEAMAQLWKETTQRLERFHREHAETTLRVSYEQLVANPQETMQKVFDFLGQSTESWDLEKALGDRNHLGLGDWKTYQRENVDNKSVGRWKKLSRNAQSRLGRILNPTLRLAGYDPLPTSPSRVNQEAQRRHELGLLLQSVKSIAT